MQMLSFFSNNNKENTESKAKTKSQASVTEIKDNIEIAEDDLVNIVSITGTFKMHSY